MSKERMLRFAPIPRVVLHGGERQRENVVLKGVCCDLSDSEALRWRDAGTQRENVAIALSINSFPSGVTRFTPMSSKNH